MKRSLTIIALSITMLLETYGSAPANFEMDRPPYSEYLGYALIGTIIAIPAVSMSHRSLNGAPQRSRSGDDLTIAARLVLLSFNLGSAGGVAWRAQYKWQTFSIALAANSLPLLASYMLEPLSLPLAMTSLAMPFVAAYIGVELDRTLSAKRRASVSISPEIFLSSELISCGVRLNF